MWLCWFCGFISCTELCGASIGEEDHEKQMGELGSGDGEQLDKNMWAPEEEEDQQNVSTTLCLLWLGGLLVISN